MLSRLISRHTKQDDSLNFYNECLAAYKKLRNFASTNLDDLYEAVSIGENCSTAWYLKELNLKNSSYPFDWIFSSPAVVEHCIETDFLHYLNKSQMYESTDKKHAGHSLYHTSMFNHRSPLKSDEDYEYYVRCCERFRLLMASDRHCLFVLTLINEPKKRENWANGFTKDFPMPENQNIQTTLPLLRKLSKIKPKSKFLIIDHYTKQKRSVYAKRISSNIFSVTFNAAGTSNGVYYTDIVDDLGYKMIFSALT
jgi:hypothetical protein